MNTGVPKRLSDSELTEANILLATLSALERVQWALDVLGQGLYALTSAGVD